jgi:hypothetical protein
MSTSSRQADNFIASSCAVEGLRTSMPGAENTTGPGLSPNQKTFRAIIQPIIRPAAFIRDCLSQLSHYADFAWREDDRVYITRRLARFVNQHHQRSADQGQLDLASSRYGKLAQPLKRFNDFWSGDGRHAFESTFSGEFGV